MSTYRKILLVAMVLAVTGCQSSSGVPIVAPLVTGHSLLAPVAAGQTLVVLNGYNNPGPGLYCPSPGVNEHDHCNNQADGFDIVPSDLADTRILAPADGTVEWVQGGCVGLRPSTTNVNLTVCHFEQASVYVQAQDAVTQGVVLGLRDPADPWVHLSIDARYTLGGGQVSPLSAAPPVALEGAFALEGHAFPASQPSVPNEWACATLTSTNVPMGDHSARPSPPSTYAQAPAMNCPSTGGTPTVDTPVPSSTLGTANGTGVRLPASVWLPVGDTSINPEAADGTFSATTGGTFWDGIRTDPAGIGCDYEFKGEARLDSGSGFGFVARATFKDGTPYGHGFQYGNDGLGPNDIEYPDQTEYGYIGGTTDSAWHSISVRVEGSAYTESFDGKQIFSGTTTSTCGGLFIRLWRTTSSFRNLEVIPIS